MDSTLSMIIGTIVGLFFLLAKILLRLFAHRLADSQSDLWLVPAWFGVDLCALSMGAVLAKNPLARFSHEEQTVCWFIGIGLLLASVWSYYRFVKRRKICSKKHPARDWRLAVFLSCGLFCGFLTLAWTISRLVPPSGGEAKLSRGGMSVVAK